MYNILYTKDLSGNDNLVIPSSDVAIVGSSGALRRNPRGSEIDSHDYVVRFNRAPTESYEELVGSRTDLRVTNNHVFNNNVLDKKVWPNQPPDFIRNLRNSRILYMASDISPWLSHSTNAHESCELFRVQYEEMIRLRHALSLDLNSMFTVGLGFVCLCLVSGLKPTLYGFDVEGGPRDHYWEDRPEAGPCHNVSQEKEILKQFHNEEMLVIK